MIIYLVMLGISLFFSVYASNAKPYPALKSTYRTFAVLSAAPFLLVTVLRYRVGTDWTFVYEPYFFYVRNGIEQFNEWGFNLLYRLFGLFTSDSWWVIAFVGFMTVLLIFLAIYRQSCLIPFSILLFFITNRYFTALNQIRQMLSMAIFVYGLRYLYERRWKSYFLWCLCAVSIHTSALMYLPLYFLYGRRFTWKSCLGLMCLSIAVAPVLGVLIQALLSVSRYGWYLNSAFQQNDFYLMGFLATVFVTMVHIYHLYRYPEPDITLEFWSVTMVAATALMFMSWMLPQVLRAAEGLSVVQIFSLPALLKKEKDGRMRLLICFFIVAGYSSKLFYDVYVNQWYDAVPYRTVFQR